MMNNILKTHANKLKRKERNYTYSTSYNYYSLINTSRDININASWR